MLFCRIWYHIRKAAGFEVFQAERLSLAGCRRLRVELRKVSACLLARPHWSALLPFLPQ